MADGCAEDTFAEDARAASSTMHPNRRPAGHPPRTGDSRRGDAANRQDEVGAGD